MIAVMEYEGRVIEKTPGVPVPFCNTPEARNSSTVKVSVPSIRSGNNVPPVQE